MKLFQRVKEKYQFAIVYKTASDDERKEMVQEYIINNSEDKFIRRMERKYNKKGWSQW